MQESLGGERLAVDLVALGLAMEVGAGEEAGSLASAAQHRLDHRSGATLAFTAGDMDRVPAALRVAQPREECTQWAQVEPIGAGLRQRHDLVVCEAVQPAQRFNVARHESSPSIIVAR